MGQDLAVPATQALPAKSILDQNSPGVREGYSFPIEAFRLMSTLNVSGHRVCAQGEVNDQQPIPFPKRSCGVFTGADGSTSRERDRRRRREPA